MNLNHEKVKDAFDRVAEKYRPKALGGKITHASSISDAEYIITRDVLVELKVNFRQAEKLARDHAGHAWTRIQRCLEHVR